MDDFILTLGWVGVYAPLALGAIGSMVGVARGGMAACGAMLEVESGYGRYIGVSAMPSSQSIYGIDHMSFPSGPRTRFSSTGALERHRV